MVQVTEFPRVPQCLMEPEFVGRIAFGRVKEKIRRPLEGALGVVPYDLERELNLSSEEAKVVALYAIALARVAAAELFDEAEKRLREL